ncbi:zinc finger CCHC domain-containing protein 14 isoform X2 [Gouania willdenowi]|uniref:zinc finger CCHC domain-containing protein 14 isoform X2 n=1 Tax=Gouania willdenowi TaxID=441366 RepID=UPI001054D3D8|nr:zinc finger CCHC domain-containing protein 14 isoform X2 [Gouania willdenowi]
MVESRGCVQREGVYRWFSSLTSAQRAEFLCGLLDLCVPIELRFLGSCLEDLASKDYHSLRDAEIKANNPTDLSGLTNITDEVVRSKLLVSLALLGSDNREAAGVLYRTLTHIDTVINNYGLSLNDGRTEEQFLLLFTMASNHPAFSFHQKQVLRQQLSHIQDILQGSSISSRGGGGGGDVQPGGSGCDRVCSAQPHPLCHPQTPSLPLASMCPATCATYLPLSACQPCICWHKSQSKELGPVPGPSPGGPSGQGDVAVTQELTSPHQDFRPPPLPPLKPHHMPSSLPAFQNQDAPAAAARGAAPASRQGKPGKVIEKVALRGKTHKSEESQEYVFEVNWSDGFVLSVVRTQQEVAELMSQLSQAFPEEGLENFLLPQSTELDPRCLSALPRQILQHRSVQLFFTSTRPLSPQCPSAPQTSSLQNSLIVSTCPFTSNSNLGFMQFKGSNRAVYRVASVQPVVSTPSSVPTRSVPHLSIIPPLLTPSLPLSHSSPQLSSLLPPVPALSTRGSTTTGNDPSSALSSSSSSFSSSLPYSFSQLDIHPQTSSQSVHLPHSQSRTQLLSQSQPNSTEQNSILDWLRRLRLHKYYPVFKQLTMEEFLALTEEDLNKYDLTQGAKKKLKTQLELQKSADREIRMDNRSHSGIARVTPSTHTGLSVHPTSTAGELRVEVDGVSHHHTHTVSTDSSSSSSYSSSSPRTPHCCDSSVDRTRDLHRRVSGPDAPAGGSEKDRSGLFMLSSSSPAGSSRPTAQVLPVQTDPAPPLSPSCSSPHLPFGLPPSPYHPQSSYTQTLLCPGSNPARILAVPRKPRPPSLCMDDRTKLLGSVLPAPGSSFGSAYGGVRLENLFPALSVERPSVQDSAVGRGLAVGLMVETSSALTSTSNSLHHVSHPPLHFHLSSSSSPSPSGFFSHPPTASSSSCTKTASQSGNAAAAAGGGYVTMATANSVPVAAIPGNSYHPSLLTCSPSPSSAATLDQGYPHSSSVCVCSSCGCRGNCGAYGALPGYAAAGYLQPISSGPSLFTLSPLLHLGPLIHSSSSTSPFSYPIMVPPPFYRHSSRSPDQQQGLGLHQPHGIMSTEGAKVAAGSLSCYNCGASGHQAEDCKLPPMDLQQGGFRLKFTPHSDSKDSGE